MEKWRVAKHEFPGYGDPKLCPFAIMEDSDFGLQIATIMGDAGLDAKAHANRIAAAPDMYEALRFAKEIIDDQSTRFHQDCRCQLCESLPMAIDAALAKADGKAGA